MVSNAFTAIVKVLRLNGAGNRRGGGAGERRAAVGDDRVDGDGDLRGVGGDAVRARKRQHVGAGQREAGSGHGAGGVCEADRARTAEERPGAGKRNSLRQGVFGDASVQGGSVGERDRLVRCRR